MILVKFEWDMRGGSVEGLFVTTHDALNEILGEEVYFGEILGKHSEIYGTLESEDFVIICEDDVLIDHLIKVFGSATLMGHNPITYLRDREDEEE
jgi:hypothetical protein